VIYFPKQEIQIKLSVFELKNYNEDGVSEQDKKDIAHSIKGCWEKRASRFENRPHTVIILSGDDTVTKYDSTLSGRIYSPF